MPSWLVGVQNGTATLEDSLGVSQKIKYSLVYNTAITLAAVYLNELEIRVHTTACVRIFTETLFTMVQTWKQQRCPSIGRWANKLGTVYTMKYCLAIRRSIKPWKDRWVT